MVGCKNSTQVTVLTTELPPVHVDVPDLIILDSRTLEAQLSKIRPFFLSMLEWDNLGKCNSSPLEFLFWALQLTYV